MTTPWKSEAANRAFKDLIENANKALEDIPDDLPYIECLLARESYIRMIAEAHKTAMTIERDALVMHAAIYEAFSR